MAGTDTSRPAVLGQGPAIILVEPQLGENIGAVARAMLNCGLTDLRLVKPRDGWPSEKARAASSGADTVIDGAQLYDTVEAATAELRHLYATTARLRDMIKPVLVPRAAIARIAPQIAAGEAAGILFGPERSGLTNDHVALADTVITFPLNPAFSSLNLAQAVLLLGWEWCQLTGAAEGMPVPPPESSPVQSRPPQSPPATREALFNLFAHLEDELDRSGFLFPPEKRPSMVRNLRNMLHRAQLSDQDVRTLHGVITCLARMPPRSG
jgi:tRNA/rRNA methyltransferase